MVGSQAQDDTSDILGVYTIRATAQSGRQLAPRSGPPLVPALARTLILFVSCHLLTFFIWLLEALGPNQLKDVFLYVALS